jgi:hypothetical protein
MLVCCVHLIVGRRGGRKLCDNNPQYLERCLFAILEIIPRARPRLPPNTALQSDPRPWRSTRSLAFWQSIRSIDVVLWRGRLNANSLGASSLHSAFSSHKNRNTLQWHIEKSVLLVSIV